MYLSDGFYIVPPNNEKFSDQAKKLLSDCITSLRPPPRMSGSEYAEKYRIISKKNSPYPGKFSLKMTPYLKEILDKSTDRESEKIIVQKSSQVGYTDGVINNALMYFIDLDPCPAGIMFPTEDMAERYSKEKFDALLEDNPRLLKIVGERKSRKSDQTITTKNYPGGHLELFGSNAPSKLASSPIRLCIVEEPDRCSLDSKGEGDAIEIFLERSKAFPNSKKLIGGSPTHELTSQISREMEISDKRKWHIDCPRCKYEITLEWSMVVWDKDENGKNLHKTARFKCYKCSDDFSNSEKNRAMINGRWIPTQDSNIAGYYINELMSGFSGSNVSIIVDSFIRANERAKHGDNRLLKTFVNQKLGETWKETVKEIDTGTFTSRLEIWHSDIPPGVIVITAGVDVGADHFCIEFVGWGLEFESWSIRYMVLYMDPHLSESWDTLHVTLTNVFFDKEGGEWQAKVVGIDSGYLTSSVYRFCNKNSYAIPVKGASEPGRPIIQVSKKKLKKRFILATIGVDTAKEIVYNQYDIKEPGPGYCHYPDLSEYDSEYFKQATAEVKVMKMHKGRPIINFILPPGKRAEALDCRIYAFSMIHYLIDYRNFKLKELEKTKPKTIEDTKEVQRVERKKQADAWIERPTNWFKR